MNIYLNTRYIISNNIIMKLFNHPAEVSMSYLQHFRFSMEIAYVFWLASMKAIVHAVYPDAYIHSTSDPINYIQERLKSAGCRD